MHSRAPTPTAASAPATKVGAVTTTGGDMCGYDDYLDYSTGFPCSTGSHEPDRLRLVAYVDGRLVDSWTEPVWGSRWERFAQEFDDERRPAPGPVPSPPRHQVVLQWLDGVVGGREALRALTSGPTAEPETPAFDGPEQQEAYTAVRVAIQRVAGELFDPEAQRVLERALALLWREARHAVTGARTPSSVAGGLCWVVGKANDLFGGGLTQQLVQRELWLKQPLNTCGQALAKQLRGIDFHGTHSPHGCPELMSFARVELLTAETRRTLIAWRDQAFAEQEAVLSATASPSPSPS